MRDIQRLIVVAVVGGILRVGILMMSRGRPSTMSANSATNSAAQATNTRSDNPLVSAATNVVGANSHFEHMSRSEAAGEIIIRLMFAVLLSGVLAFRPRKDVPLFRRSLFVSQTQILLAVVAAALMMVVGDSAARAFAIFAAASLVRFRTNIRDPKEITVLLISLALGLAAGVGRWELAI